ncbi:exodeoxyribonuclease VII large subunit [Xanthocytophaga agilis]|uniref:Exodeoxyribonuclease 7 large subunit n=1 Tax=Xanthocytophaga agilis TaxID=3048010 RepID=A0AAE3RB16_9BACT|nr:exodeoxyribonuclease VII large subunit [Xanthocytophaga agilis]MDJ1504759.1 exodeoxyribonuclease VII large subunit [Xanthocytophaga agilis]
MNDILSVSDLTHVIKAILEEDPDLQQISVKGEVSNLTIHSSGHAYFTLKDEESQISCVMFRGQISPLIRPLLKAGAKLVVEGDVTVYVSRGQYQMQVTSIRDAGIGDLFQQFLLLKEKLKEEGLFEWEHKKPLPAFPQKIGIVTSPTGAVIQDMLRVFERRYPCVEVILSPSLVQGDLAAESVIRAFRRLQEEPDLDVIIIARGGGSTEDLWGFNDERLARTIFDSAIPVVSAIGHETDFTILDFVADVRAATPTAAAELTTPDRAELLNALDSTKIYFLELLQKQLNESEQFLDDFTERLGWQMSRLLQNNKSQLDLLEAQLQILNPKAFLTQGYSITLKDGKKILSSEELQKGDEIETVLQDGRVTSIVK